MLSKEVRELGVNKLCCFYVYGSPQPAHPRYHDKCLKVFPAAQFAPARQRICVLSLNVCRLCGRR